MRRDYNIDIDNKVLLALEELNINTDLTNLEFVNKYEAKLKINKVLSKFTSIDIKMIDILINYLIANNLIKIEPIKVNFSRCKIIFNFINTLYLMRIDNKLKIKNNKE